jgi:hypothetical protein
VRRWVWVAVVVFVVAIPAFLILRKRRMADDLGAFLTEAGWTKTACPATEPFGHRDMREVRCFAGRLGDGRAVTLLLGTRWQSETANVPKGSGIAQESFIGFTLAADDRWLDAWKTRLGRGGDDPIRVARSGDDAVVVWRGLHQRDGVIERLHDLETFPKSP